MICYPIIRHALHAYARSFHRHAAAHAVVSVVCVATAGIGALVAVPAIEADSLPLVYEAPWYGHAASNTARCAEGFDILVGSERQCFSHASGGHAALNVPEPSSLAVFVVGLVMYAGWRLSRKGGQ